MNPWMSKAEIATIIKYLTPQQVMLEYGCGGSTTTFCNYVKEYYSVEHNRKWYNKIIPQIKSNTKFFCVESNHVTPNTDRILARSWDTLDSSSRSKDFKDYIQFPKSLGKTFDAVLIDGRARPECAKFIYDYLKKDGVIFVHDYWARKPYHVIEEKYKVIDAVKSGQSLAVLKKDI
jgi:spermidine synthase